MCAVIETASTHTFCGFAAPLLGKLCALVSVVVVNDLGCFGESLEYSGSKRGRQVRATNQWSVENGIKGEETKKCLGPVTFK